MTCNKIRALGFEPRTPELKARCSTRLSYAIRTMGLEPITPAPKADTLPITPCSIKKFGANRI